MSTQRKLHALLYELQSARNPLAQAKVLAPTAEVTFL